MGEPVLHLYDTGKDLKLRSYLNADGGYWINNDIWRMCDLQVTNSSFYKSSKVISPMESLWIFRHIKTKE